LTWRQDALQCMSYVQTPHKMPCTARRTYKHHTRCPALHVVRTNTTHTTKHEIGRVQEGCYSDKIIYNCFVTDDLCWTFWLVLNMLMGAEHADYCWTFLLVLNKLKLHVSRFWHTYLPQRCVIELQWGARSSGYASQSRSGPRWTAGGRPPSRACECLYFWVAWAYVCMTQAQISKPTQNNGTGHQTCHWSPDISLFHLILCTYVYRG
jgi:hypothetical protein